MPRPLRREERRAWEILIEVLVGSLTEQPRSQFRHQTWLQEFLVQWGVKELLGHQVLAQIGSVDPKDEAIEQSRRKPRRGSNSRSNRQLVGPLLATMQDDAKAVCGALLHVRQDVRVGVQRN